MKNLSSNTKKGVASLYIVIFATMLFGVITLSCMRIMLSEFGQSSEDDLSRSAYDAAMAGVEDAKTAVNRYYKCLGGNGEANKCDEEARKKLFSSNCDTTIGVAEYLYGAYNVGTDSPEVMVQEGSNGTSGNDNNADQAYTCVIVNDVTPDYRGTLTSDTKTKVVPLGVRTPDRGTNLSEVKSIRLSWYSQLNEGATNASQFNLSPGKTLNTSQDATAPPTVSATLIRAKGSIVPSELHTANNGADYSTVVLLPSEQPDNPDNRISYSFLRDSGNVKNSEKHEAFPVSCYSTTEFACSVDFDVNGMDLTNNDSMFLVLSLPYGETITDFAVTLYNGEGNPINFKGVQISVDSTGRTNQLFRRVETRLDPSDMYFPFPQYELELSGSGDDVFWKNFWITANCWYSQPSTGDGTANTCDNNGRL